MSGFLFGKNVEARNVSGPAASFNDQMLQYLQGRGFGGLFPGTSFSEQDAAPYRKGFADTNAQTFGQAKEAAGNLTGSGLSNSLGTAAQRASNEQGAFLANLFEQRRQQDADRFLQAALGAQNSQAAQITRYHQPGLLEEGAKAVGAAAPFLIPGAQPLAAANLAGGGGNLAQQMVAGDFGLSAPSTLPAYTGPGSFIAGPGQLGQASRYNFDFTHTDKLNSGQGSPYRGYANVNLRDRFGVPYLVSGARGY